MATNQRRIPITSNKSNLLDFTKFITEFLDKELQSSSLKCSWKDSWLTLKNEQSFGTRKFTRFQLAKAVIGNDADDKSLTNIINQLQILFPPIKEKFTFTPNANDTDLWILTNKDITDQTTENLRINDTEHTDIIDESEGWTTMPSNTSTNETNNMYITPENKPKEMKHPSFTNSFASLAHAEYL